MNWVQIIAKRLLVIMGTLALVSCVSGVLQYEEVEKLEINEEYDKMIQVKEIPAPPTQDGLRAGPAEIKDKKDLAKPKLKPSVGKKESKIKKDSKAIKDLIVKKEVKEVQKAKVEADSPKPLKRQPEIEDSIGFSGRRPIADPFRSGEKVVLAVKYFAMQAGEITLETKPYVEVNGRQAYHFVIALKTHSFFNSIYSVDDWAETFLDFEELTPYNLAVHIKESKQLKESRSVYNFETMEANFWEKKVTEDKGEKNKKATWKIEPFSQNVVSAIFYLRTFTFIVGKSINFRVADAGKNILFKAEVLREEQIEHEKKTIDTYVLKIEFEQDGVFKKTGDVFLWFTKDARKFPVRVESKIKIGTLVGALKSITPGL